MTLAIISDIHSNLEALSAVLDDIRRRSVDEIVCLGDIVGYGPDPHECLATVRALNCPIILGNHDVAAFDQSLRATFSPLARRAIEWTAPLLAEEELKFLQSLPYTIQRHGQTFVHAAPLSPEEFEYILDDVDASRNFPAFSTPLCFIGHTHQPDIFCEDLSARRVKSGKRFIVNAGSVGQPRDGDARACYGLFDDEDFSFEHVRITYDIAATAEKIYAAGLPRQLGERLVLGI